jgi:hypothetical protein
MINGCSDIDSSIEVGLEGQIGHPAASFRCISGVIRERTKSLRRASRTYILYATTVNEVERISRLLFGSKYRLPVAAAVAGAPEGGLYTRAIAKSLAIPDNLVAGELRRMEEAGLLVESPDPASTRTLYTRVPSIYWESAIDLVADVSSPEASVTSLLKRGESETVAIRGAALSPIGPWLHGQGWQRENTPAHIMYDLTAFLNTRGGTILVGALDTAHARPESEEVPMELIRAPRVEGFAIVGLIEPAYQHGGWDGWERRLRTAIEELIEPSPAHFAASRLRDVRLLASTCFPAREPATGFARSAGTVSQ